MCSGRRSTGIALVTGTNGHWRCSKGDDETARPADAGDILEGRQESVKTGSVVDQVASEGPAWSSKTGKVERSAEPIAAAAPEAGKLKGARKDSLYQSS